MLHANAALTPAQRLKLARLIVEEGWPTAWAAKFFTVSWKTADRWARRYRAEGKAGMVDRCCRPHTSPTKTDPATTKRIVSLRLRKRWGGPAGRRKRRRALHRRCGAPPLRRQPAIPPRAP